MGFGLDSKAEYQDLLSYCQSKGGCGPADRPRADRGKTDQTVEYASIAAASVAAAAPAAFAVVAITHPARSRATSQARWQVLVGATAWGLRCDFP